MMTMKKTYRKIVALLAVTALLLSVLPLMSLTAFAMEGTLVLDEGIYVEADGEDKTFTFVPEESGVYVFYSYDNDGDTYGDVFDADEEWVNGDDDGGVDMNFMIVCRLLAGETYSLTCNTYGGTGTYWIAVMQSPVKSVEVEPVEIIVGTNGYMNFDYDVSTDSWSDEYYYYSPENLVEYTVTWNDGTTTTCYNGEEAEYDGKFYAFEITTDQTYDNQWVLGGAYTATMEMAGISADFPVTITKSPVQSIDVAPAEIIVGTNGYWASDYIWVTDSWTEDYYYYYPENALEYTITLDDGETLNGCGSESVSYDGVEYDPEVTYEQTYDTRWLPGNTYTATLEVMGASVDFTVAIVDAPIKSIEAKPVEIIVETNGSWTYDYDWMTDESTPEYYYYFPGYVLEYTVNWNDGTTSDHSAWEDLEYDGDYYTVSVMNDQTYENRWLLGNTYAATMEVMGVSVDFPVTITESPIESIEVKPAQVMEETHGYWDADYNEETEDWDLEYYHYYPDEIIEYTVTWKDGTTSTVDDEGYIYYDGEPYYAYYDYDQSYEDQWLLGNTYTMTMRLMGVSAEVSVTIVENTGSGSDIEVTTKGDIDGDGSVNANDAVVLFYAVNGIRNEITSQMDMNGDDVVNLYDAARLFYYVNGLTEIL